MPRAKFGGGVGDQVFVKIPLGNRTLFGVLESTITLTAWDEPDGTQITDLRAADGATPITTVAVPPGGMVPEFYGPTDVTELYLQDPDGDFYRFTVGPQGPAGSGAVDSVNSQTGEVVLTQDNIPDGATAKKYLATDVALLRNAPQVGKNPYNYGAVGDFSADDTDAIQAAVTAGGNPASGGAGVTVPPGLFKVSAPIVGPSGAQAFGAGVGQTIIRAAPGATMEALWMTEDGQLNWLMTLADIQFDGNRANGAQVDHAVKWFGASDSSIHRLRVVQVAGQGVLLTGDSGHLGTANTLDDVRVRGCDDIGILNDVFTTDTSLLNCDAGQCDNHAIFMGGSNSSIEATRGWGSLTGLYAGGQILRIGGGSRFDNNQINGLVIAGAEVQVAQTQVHSNSAAAADTHAGILVVAAAGRVQLGAGVRSFNSGISGYGTQSYGLQLEAGRTGPTLVEGGDYTGNASGAIDYQGHVAGDRISHAAGYNPQPAQSPTMPASTTVFTNPFPYDCTVYINNTGVSNVYVGGTYVSSWYSLGGIRVPVGQTIRVDYGGATPGWTWFSD